MRAILLSVTSLGFLAACSSPASPPRPMRPLRIHRPRTHPRLPARLFSIKRARFWTRISTAPAHRSGCFATGSRRPTHYFPEPFRATYNAEGRLADYYREPRGLAPERVQLEYEEGRLVRIGRRVFTYDEGGRLTGFGTRSFHYDDEDRLIRIEDPSGFHGTSRFTWLADGRLETIVSGQEGGPDAQTVQTFQFDESGRLAHHTVIQNGDVWLDVDLEYENGDLIRIGETVLLYSDEPLDIPDTSGLNPAWFLSGAQSELYLRTGSPTRPWRVYLGDHPGGFVAAFPEFRSAHRRYGRYEMDGDSVIATYFAGNEHQMTFVPASDCMGAPIVSCTGPSNSCLDTEFCLYDTCSYDATGVCTPIPVDCPSDAEPVCGCDGVTYENECTAHAAGVSAYGLGQCCDEPSIGPTCGLGEYCRFALEPEGCGVDDSIGACTTVPDSCDATPSPVCACDGMTYENECLANMAGQSVQYPGPC